MDAGGEFSTHFPYPYPVVSPTPHPASMEVVLSETRLKFDGKWRRGRKARVMVERKIARNMYAHNSKALFELNCIPYFKVKFLAFSDYLPSSVVDGSFQKQPGIPSEGGSSWGGTGLGGKMSKARATAEL